MKKPRHPKNSASAPQHSLLPLFGSLIGSALLAGTSPSAQAGTLPQGSFSASWTTATARSNSLWYVKDGSPQLFETTGQANGEYFRDVSTSIKVNYGLSENIELFASVGLINKSHYTAPNTQYIARDSNNQTIYGFDEITKYKSVTEPTYLVVGAKTPLPSLLGIDWSAYAKLGYAFNADQDYFFTSGNDRSHNIQAGLEASASLPYQSYLFADGSFKYRTAHAMQAEGTLGAGLTFLDRFSFSAFYYYLWGQETIYNCFHSLQNLIQFHETPLWKEGSTNATYDGPGWDSHHGPGASLSMALNQTDTGYLSLELFTYMKVGGANTDKSTSFGANLNYLFY